MSIKKIALVMALILVAAVAWLPGVDTAAERAAEDGLKRSLTTYGVVRAVSSTVAVLGSANAGLLKVGEVLHPVEKLIDQFLDVMLIASASFALQIFLLKICSHWLVSTLLTLIILYFAWSLTIGKSSELRFAKSCLVLLLLVRFSMPIASAATQEIYMYALKGSEDKALTFVDKVGMAGGEGEERESGPWWKRLSLEKIKDKLDALMAGVGTLAKQFAQLIASYVLQSIILPIGFILIFWFLARAACSRMLSVKLPINSKTMVIPT